jgi:energy-coupling factor transporter ATP-binding protein EcfA2
VPLLGILQTCFVRNASNLSTASSDGGSRFWREQTRGTGLYASANVRKNQKKSSNQYPVLVIRALHLSSIEKFGGNPDTQTMSETLDFEVVRSEAAEDCFTLNSVSPEGAIKERMRLGDLLIQAKLVTQNDVTKALEVQAEIGGRLGNGLVAIGAISQKVLDAFIHRMPTEPSDMKATRIDPIDLLSLLMRIIYTDHLESVRQFIEAIKLPYNIVHDLVQMAIDRKLLQTLGTRESENLLDMKYTFTDAGQRWAMDAINQLRYTGPAPVTIEEFSEQVNLQKITNETITFDRIRGGLGDLTVEDSLIEHVGPALNSGRAILLYGPPGNGKTSVALSFAGVFTDVIYIPYAVIVEGQIMRIFDSSVHTVLTSPPSTSNEGVMSFLRSEEYDARWVPCRRPFVVTGGELTLEMLDLRYDATANYYEAPLHVKALGGCFVIDDFGRQLVSPKNLLNRWIVPLESRCDSLKLHTGKSFTIPFEELVIFSTNMEPEELMDPAFLRRLPYKIEVGGPRLDIFKRIFEKECERQALAFSEEAFEFIVHKVVEEKGLELANFQPRFIIDQVVATCRFMGEPAHFEPRFIEYAVDNLRVRRHTPLPANPVHAPETIAFPPPQERVAS